MADTVRLIGPTQRAHAHRLIDAAAPTDVMKLAAETRRDRQNAKLHAMIGDLREQVPDMARFTVAQCKLRFMDALGEEMTYLPKLYGEGFFPVGAKTSTLTVAQFAGLVNLLYIYGGEQDVRWSEPSRDEACARTTEMYQHHSPDFMASAKKAADRR